MTLQGPVLLTGATGFIGGFLAAELLRRGVRVVAPVRSVGGRGPDERAAGLLRFFDLPRDAPLEVFEGDVELPNLGMDGPTSRRLRRQIGSVLHCAANTSFAGRKADEVQRVNARGAEHVFHAVGGVDSFWHMSTAYAVGAGPGLHQEELRAAESFNNLYERSKNQAELRLAELCDRAGTVLKVFRPSIVYGDSRTGRCLSFKGLYYPVRTLLFLRDSMVRDVRKHGGARAAKLGVELEKDGSVSMPLFFPGGGSINLIPVDHLVRSVLEIGAADICGVFHVVSPEPLSVSVLLDYIESCFDIRGIEVADDYRDHNGALQKLVNGYMELYYPYFCDRRRFDDTRARSVLSSAGLSCPPLDLPAFRRCMEYAVSRGWSTPL